jgi:hypothetical protein
MKNLGGGGRTKGSLSSGMSFSGGRSLPSFGFYFGEPFLPAFGLSNLKVNTKKRIMNKSKILEIQIRTDLEQLEKDVEAGLFDSNPKGYFEARERIMDKMREMARQMEIERFERLAESIANLNHKYQANQRSKQ